MVFMDAYLINMITETCRRLHNIHWGCVSGFIISSTAVFIHRGSRCTDRPRGHCSCKSSSLLFKLLHLSLLSYVLFSTSSCSEPLVRSFPSGVNTQPYAESLWPWNTQTHTSGSLWCHRAKHVTRSQSPASSSDRLQWSHPRSSPDEQTHE